MGATIGGKNVDTCGLMLISGFGAPEASFYERGGVDDLGMLTLPSKPHEVTGPTVRDVANEALAYAEANSYTAMIGTSVVIVDQFGRTWTGVRIKGCVPIYGQVLADRKSTRLNSSHANI